MVVTLTRPATVVDDAIASIDLELARRLSKKQTLLASMMQHYPETSHWSERTGRDAH